MQKKEEREKNFFQYGKDLPSELKLQKEIECYDKVMELDYFYRNITITLVCWCKDSMSSISTSV